MSEETQALVLLPTTSKDKIGQHLSYPIGAQSLSCAFVDLPQAAKSSISFSGTSPLHSLAGALRYRDERGTILTCRCEGNYDTTYCPSNVGKLRDIAWKVTIYPVLREWKPLVHESLEVEGLAKLREFLLRTHVMQKRPETGSFSITYNPREERLEFSPFPH